MEEKPMQIVKTQIKPIYPTAILAVAWGASMLTETSAIFAGLPVTRPSLVLIVMPLGIIVAYILFAAIYQVEKTNIDQQTQIDDLKRELEEMKQKQ